MNNIIDIEVAMEILAIKLSKDIFKKEKLESLLEEKKLVSLGDKKTIEKVIKVYGEQIKEELANANKQ